MAHDFGHPDIRSTLRISGLICVLMLLSRVYVSAQIDYNDMDGRVNTINTAVPFLRISPDARSGAMGDAGIAISPDANAVYWNLAKIPFATKDMGVSVTYTPWLRTMASDVFLGYLSAYKKLDDRQALGLSVRYFDMGSVQLTNFEAEDIGKSHPREYSIDGGYARQLSAHWSAAVALRFIHSDLASGTKRGDAGSYKAGNAVAGDLSAYYTSGAAHDTSRVGGSWSFGVTLTNLGTKIGYTADDNDKYNIPSNLGVGGAYTYRLDEKNTLTLALDINKLMVPTPDTLDANRNSIPDYREKSVVSGLFGSFGDAPGGMQEEFHELMYSAGVEYCYDDLFALRAGYYNEYKTKGDRKYLTVGFGVKYKVADFDFSYLVPSGGSSEKNPLSNTLRLTISLTQ